MSILNIVTDAHNGSATAQALLEQISREERESAEAAFRMEAARKQKEALERSAKIEAVQTEIKGLMAQYEELRAQIEPLVVRMAELDLELPFSYSNRAFPPHLRYVHLPSATLGSHDVAKPLYSTMESLLMQKKL